MEAADESAQADGVPVTTALSDGLITLLTPLVGKCNTGIQQALDSQALLSKQIDRVAAELQAFLGASQLPSFAPYSQRLAEVRRRTAVASTTLQQINARLARLEAMAERLQAEESLHLQRAPPPNSGLPDPSVD